MAHVRKGRFALRDRRESAQKRQEERNSRTNEQQIALIIQRGYPDCKEVKRLK